MNETPGESSAELFEDAGVISRRRRHWRRWWRRIHLIVGLAVGVLIALVFATGSVLVASYTVDRWVNPQVHTEADADTPRVPLEEVVRAAQRTAPTQWGPPVRLSLPGRATYGAEENYEILFQEPGACPAGCGASGPGSTYDTGLHYLYVDPGTGQVVAERSAPAGHPSVFWWEVHAQLLSGQTGRWLVVLSGLVLLVSAVTGLVLWWPLGRRGVGFRIRRGQGRFVYDLHNAVGFYVSAGLLLLALTGVLLGATRLPPFDTAIQNAIGSTSTTPTAAVPPPGAQRIPVDDAVRIAAAAVPDAEVAQVRLPSLAGYTGQRPVGSYQVSLRPPNEFAGVKSLATVSIEPWTGRVLAIEDSRDDSAGQQIVGQWAADIHDGSAGGPVGKILVFLLGLTPAGLLVTGWMMWRTRTRRNRFAPDTSSFRSSVRPSVPYLRSSHGR